MPARTFLSAERLGLEQKHFDALVMTLHAMERGALVHKPVAAWDTAAVDRSKFNGLFNMAVWESGTRCGTVCCIGGSAEILAGLSSCQLLLAADRNKKLEQLFYPNSVERNLCDITVDQARDALANYLTTGDANWRAVFAVGNKQ